MIEYQETQYIINGNAPSNNSINGKLYKQSVEKCNAIANLYGTGHGKHGDTKGLRPRHAKLAVGSIATLATFLYDTHKETKV